MKEEKLLRDEHSRTERALLEAGEEMQTDLEKRAEEASLLHGKIGRKQAVEQHNTTQLETYCVDLHTNIDSMVTTIDNHNVKCTDIMSQITAVISTVW